MLLSLQQHHCIKCMQAEFKIHFCVENKYVKEAYLLISPPLSNSSSPGRLFPGVAAVLFPATFAAVAEMGISLSSEASVFEALAPIFSMPLHLEVQH